MNVNEILFIETVRVIHVPSKQAIIVVNDKQAVIDVEKSSIDRTSCQRIDLNTWQNKLNVFCFLMCWQRLSLLANVRVRVCSFEFNYSCKKKE
jgi:hypothetical protein